MNPIKDFDSALPNLIYRDIMYILFAFIGLFGMLFAFGMLMMVVAAFPNGNIGDFFNVAMFLMDVFVILPLIVVAIVYWLKIPWDTWKVESVPGLRSTHSKFSVAVGIVISFFTIAGIAGIVLLIGYFYHGDKIRRAETEVKV